MNLNLHFGKDKNDKDIYIDLQKENLHTMFMTGSTGTGKSILHYYLYKQLMDQNTPEELGFVFMDMTRVDFILWKNPYLYQPVIITQDKAIDVLEKLANENPKKKNIFIHIEECDMFMLGRDRIENAWEKIQQSNYEN
jgi:DNA segregation ATPase FtsK/SpoIIIE-like protein